MAPLLSRGLTEKLTATLRKVATIIVSAMSVTPASWLLIQFSLSGQHVEARRQRAHRSPLLA